MPTPPDAGFIALQAALAGVYSLDRELGRGGIPRWTTMTPTLP